MELLLAVGELKKHEGSVVFRPEREAQVIDGLKSVNAGPLKSDSVAPIWREIMSACRALETPTRVAYLGPAGTFSEQAALGYFGASIVSLPCTSIDEVFRATAAGAADFGVVPVENSTEGVVARSLDLFLATPLVIVGETSLFVRHNLLRKLAPLGEFAALSSRAELDAWQARSGGGDLRAFLDIAADLDLWRIGRGTDRFMSYGCYQEEGGRLFPAGIWEAGPAALDVAAIREDIARAWYAAAGQPQPQATGSDCTSLVVSVANRPGAVHDMLVPLKAHGVSMSRFESRPARSGQWEYYFYIDLQGHPQQAHVAAALQELRATCAFFKLLGSYPIDTH